jgi:magnesium transporter
MIQLDTEFQHDLIALLDGGDPSIIAERVRALPPDQIARLLAALHPADSADVLEEFELDAQRAVFAELEPDDAAEVLAYLPYDEQADVIARMPAADLAEILDEMEPDDAADVLGELPKATANAVLAGMEDAAPVARLLGYDEESAGGLMTDQALSLRADATVRQAMALIRQLQAGEDLSFYLYVVDASGRLVGVVSLRQLLRADPAVTLGLIMHRDVISVGVDADQEEAARVLSRYGLLALPTVDADGRLVGVITADDVIDVLQEEATEDIYRLAGMDAEERVDRSVWASSRQRLFWLFVNLPNALFVSFIVSLFAPTIDRVTILAAFMPIVAGMGGNAGIQTLTLIVRSIALGELRLSESWRALGREAVIGLCNGVCIGFAIGLVGYLWQGMPILGLIAALAMIANLLAAAVAGTLVPLGLKRAGADPALASGVIVTALTDITGYSVFLGLATVLIEFFPLA